MISHNSCVIKQHFSCANFANNRKQLENELFQSNTYMIGFLDPLAEGDHVKEWQACGVNTFSVDCFKSISVDDPKNMQAAMSWIAGRLAFRDGIHRYQGNQEKN